MGKVLPHDRLAAEFAGRAHFLAIYVREAHPGEHFSTHETLEQKKRQARRFVETDGLQRRLLIDDLSGSVHRAYGAWPNICYVIDAAGRIVLRQRWGDPRVIRSTLERLLAGEAVAPQSTRAFRIRGPFVRVLRRAGATAVKDFFLYGGFPVLYAVARLWESLRG